MRVGDSEHFSIQSYGKMLAEPKPDRVFTAKMKTSKLWSFQKSSSTKKSVGSVKKFNATNYMFILINHRLEVNKTNFGCLS